MRTVHHPDCPCCGSSSSGSSSASDSGSSSSSSSSSAGDGGACAYQFSHLEVSCTASDAGSIPLATNPQNASPVAAGSCIYTLANAGFCAGFGLTINLNDMTWAIAVTGGGGAGSGAGSLTVISTSPLHVQFATEITGCGRDGVTFTFDITEP